MSKYDDRLEELEKAASERAIADVETVPRFYDGAGLFDVTPPKATRPLRSDDFSEFVKRMEQYQGRCTADPLQDAADQFFRQKFRHVYEQREHLCEVWIAETGLLPSESVLCAQDVVGPDGTVVTRCWIERRKDSDRVR